MDPMPSEVQNVKLVGAAQNSAANGVATAQIVLSHIREGKNVALEFSDVERMTASFANALVMTLLESMGEDGLDKKIELINAAPIVAGEWQKAVERYQRGVRLSTQRHGAA